MRAVLTQHGLEKALEGKAKVSPTMTEEQWTELDERALSSIQLCLTREVLREVIHEVSVAGLWSKLESLYMTKSLANKLRLKEKLYTLRMKKGSELQAHLNEFSSILIDLENLDIKIKDEDKAVLVICSLPPSYKHFKEIMFYGDNVECISLEDVKSSLLAKEKFDIDKPSKALAEGLYVKGMAPRLNLNRSLSSRPPIATPVTTKLETPISECYKLKNKEKYAGKEHPKQGEHQNYSNANVCSDGDLLLVGDMLATTDSDAQDTTNEWIIDSGCTFHMCPYKDWFLTYQTVRNHHVLLGNNAPCKVLGVGTVKLKTHDGVERTLSEVRHILDLRRNIISLGTLEAKGFKYNGEDGVLKIFKGSMVILKAQRRRGRDHSTSLSVTTESRTKDDTKLWHLRLGHMGMNGLTTLCKRGLLGKHTSCKLEFCEQCILG
ncbi:hypothetical protein V2J09_022029 [Rumex salicifolius]